jgi:adenylate cyclase
MPRRPRGFFVVLRKLAAGLGLGLTAAAVTLFLARAGALEEAELSTYDWRIRAAARPDSISQDIVLVELNDMTIRDLSPFVGRWPWPRMVMAGLVNYLNRAPARVIALDIGFWEPDRVIGVAIGERVWSGEESDAALAQALGKSPASVLLADAIVEEQPGANAETMADWRSASLPFRLNDTLPERRRITPPFEPLLSSSTLLGHNFLPLDVDGPARRMPPFIRNGDRYMPSLGVAAALLAVGVKAEDVTIEHDAIRMPGRRMPLVPLRVPDLKDPSRYREQMTVLINYQAPPLLDSGRRPFPSFEVRDLLASEEAIGVGEPPRIDPEIFKDKIVFVGLSASGLVDVFATPFGAGKGNMPGIQLHATMADNLLSNRFIEPASDRLRIAAVVLAGVLVGLLSALLPFTPAATGALLAVGGWTWYALVSFTGGVWLNMVQPIATIATALFVGTTYQYFVEGREKRIVKALFGRYVSRDVYKQLIENPSLAELGGRRREMTVLFSDIRGFTSVTEKGEPEALVAQLNEYFSTMVDVVFRHHGTIDKFVGDMVMALFGAPVDDEAHAEHAVAAAVDMVRELAELNHTWVSQGKVPLDIGIGVNSGSMIAGNIGSSSIMSYTVIGDHVNLGSRLESLNKEFGTRIIISDATRSRLHGSYQLRPLGDVVVKGKSHPVAIFEVVVPSPVPQAAEETKS